MRDWDSPALYQRAQPSLRKRVALLIGRILLFMHDLDLLTSYMRAPHSLRKRGALQIGRII